MTDVKCKVKSCYYWNNGDVCQADSITVDNNLIGRASMEAGSLDVTTTKTSGRGRKADNEVGDLDVGRTTGISSEQGTRTGTESQNVAKTSHETLCTTFRPKGTNTAEPRH